MTLYEFFKNKYKTQGYPIIDERQFDELVAEIRAESAERIKELEVVISKMETTTPKWVSVKDRLPEEGVFVYAVGQHLEGLLCFKENEWYTKEEVIDEPNRYWEFEGYYKDAIDYWMEKPLPPTTEEK